MHCCHNRTCFDCALLLLLLLLPPYCRRSLSPAAFALICDYVSNTDPGIRAGAILGLGLAYAGTQREEVQELLVPLVRSQGGRAAGSC
jgi:26S proteasome regulatory subunit N1